jgi:REP element-mobilizing transposase RayT
MLNKFGFRNSGTDQSVPYESQGRECIYAFRLRGMYLCGILVMVMQMTLPKRKLPRLKEYDYATPGAYFITICCHNRQCIFGNIVFSGMPGEAYMQYSPIGEIAKQCLLNIEAHYDNVKINNWVIMPNHVHLLIHIEEQLNLSPTTKFDIPNIVGKHKAAVTRSVRNSLMHSGKLWQASYYDHVVRNDEDYQNIWQYISGNPSEWLDDRFYCE